MTRRSLNVCVLSGNLGSDPKVREAGDTKVASFPLGVSNYKGETTWANIVTFGKTAEIVEQYVKKGSGVQVVGTYQSRKYEVDGDERYSHEFIVDELILADRPSDDEGGTTTRTTSASKANATASTKRAATATPTTSTARKGMPAPDDDTDDPF